MCQQFFLLLCLIYVVTINFFILNIMKRNSFLAVCLFLIAVVFSACISTQEKPLTSSQHYAWQESVCLTEGATDSLRLMVVVDFPLSIEGVTDSVLDVINTALVRHSFGEDYCDYASMDTVIARFRQDVVNEYRRDNLPLYEQNEANDADYVMNLNNEHLLTVSPMTEQGRIVSFAVERYLFLGGAHGINNRQFLNFDKRTGRLLSEDDVFVSEATDALTHLLLLNLVRQNDDLSLISDVEASDYEKEAIRPNGNFYFAPEGVVYIFNPYEIGPYSLGETNICIPVEEIKPYICPDWEIYAE